MKPEKVDLVHYAVPHPSTKKIGMWSTPLVNVATACSLSWSQRPRRTLLPKLVTCPHCLDWIAKNHLTVIADVAKLKRSA